MRHLYSIIFILLFFGSCSMKNQIVYLNDIQKQDANSWTDFSNLENSVDAGDILKIDVTSSDPKASAPYNKKVNFNQSNLDMLKLDGYIVSEQMTINYPVLGTISIDKLSEEEIEGKIERLLSEGDHLSMPNVSVRRINNKFTVLGEVNNPGTYSYFEKNINILQALGYAGDLTIDGKRKNLTLVRKENGVSKAYNIELTKSEFLKSPLYNIKNNDVLIINPTFSKVKSAGFIGSPSSVASIASLLLSITLLITNN